MTDIKKKYIVLRESYSLNQDRDAFLSGLKKLIAQTKKDDLGHWKMFFEGRMAWEKNELKQVVEIYSKQIEQYLDYEALDTQISVAWSMLNMGAALNEQDKPDEAITTFNNLIDRFEKSKVTEIRTQIAMALVNKGVALGQQNKPEEEITTYNDLIGRFGKSKEPELKIRVAKALYNKGVALNEQGKPDKAIAAYDDLIIRFENTKIPEIKKRVVMAIRYKGITLQELGKQEEALKAFQKLLELRTNDEFAQQRIALLKDEENLNVYIEYFDQLLDEFKKTKRKKFFKEIEARKKRTEKFLSTESNFKPELSVLLDLREWNSFTPAVPDHHEVDRGGGYFIRYKNQGIVIDPGYDFIKNFGDADGRICDIDHIVITHAHNDHTQDFESLLSLLYQYNQDHAKRIHIYLSTGAFRKVSGYLPLRGAPYIDRIEILNQGNSEHPQVIPLHGLDGATFTVLSAFHDDTIALDYSVGLGFEFEFGEEIRRVVFTGDTGLFPPRKDDKGEVVLNEKETDLVLDINDEKALYNAYPEKFKEPDMLIPHIGSIKKYEFKKVNKADLKKQDHEQPLIFYPNHLGVRGLFMLLHKLQPKAAIISEFGEELKNIRFDLARGINKLLKKRADKGISIPLVIPGDLTIVYDIENSSFLCHDTKEFHFIDTVKFKEVDEPKESRFYCLDASGKSIQRTYLFSEKKSKEEAIDAVEDYCKYSYKRFYPPYCVKKRREKEIT